MCNHKSTTIDEDFHIVVCTSCGEVIKEEVYLAKEPAHTDRNSYGRVYVRNPHNITYRHRHSRAAKETLSKRRGRPKKLLSTVTDMSEIEDTGIRDIIEMGKSKGVKNTSHMTKAEICKYAGVILKTKPPKVTLTNTISGEVLSFHSLYKASKDLKVSTGSLSYFDGKSKGIMINGKEYLVKRM